ncbi:MAG: hypothetical protein ONB48_10305 [candidate division KSB1 bacterium]|nr:hypothetical protein [candidate division KSB1 bacterium]MDZ7273880.1 hypothetical protein [candidate division KSB1 bacterium]MDZ7286036.1 hypothetical protein [candidate division KSB1 bacterium]MDZ7299068.1 hypothetical protein [candidate division KSB1 bacterium]MDZ7308205.1 hypothetical protein [candidate division KSB1 bacterium]
MTSPLWLNLLKTLHLLFIIAGAGGALGQYVLVRRFRQAHTTDAEASEKMALVLTRFLEVYGLLLAFVTGLILAVLTGAFAAGYLHLKIVLVLIVIALSHLELRNLKRMAALRAQGQGAEAAQLKQRHLWITALALTLLVVIILLVIFKPF